MECFIDSEICPRVQVNYLHLYYEVGGFKVIYRQYMFLTRSIVSACRTSCALIVVCFNIGSLSFSIQIKLEYIGHSVKFNVAGIKPATVLY